MLCKNDYTSGSFFKNLFLAAKIMYCLTIDKYDIVQEHKTFKGFNDSKQRLDCSQYFEMIDDNKFQLRYQNRGNHLMMELSYQ